MDDPKRNPLVKQTSLSYIEQSLKIIPTPPQPAPVTIYRGPKAQNANLSKADIEIADRLKKLRQKDEDLPTEEEMASRLAQLKGLPADHYSKPNAFAHQPPDTRTNVEKSDDLIRQVMNEVVLDAKVPSPTKELEARLAKLRDTSENPTSPPTATGQSEGVPSIAMATAPPSNPLDFHDEVNQLLKETEEEVRDLEAKGAALLVDPEVSAALTEAKRKKKTKKGHPPAGGSPKSTSSEELQSNDSSSDLEKDPKKMSKEEKAEVERIVAMYKKKQYTKKKKKDLMNKAPPLRLHSDSDSDLEVESTSDSERLSDSD